MNGSAGTEVGRSRRAASGRVGEGGACPRGFWNPQLPPQSGIRLALISSTVESVQNLFSPTTHASLFALTCRGSSLPLTISSKVTERDFSILESATRRTRRGTGPADGRGQLETGVVRIKLVDVVQNV